MNNLLDVDKCYTCGEDDSYCECSEGFDSVNDRFRNDDWDDGFAPGDPGFYFEN